MRNGRSVRGTWLSVRACRRQFQDGRPPFLYSIREELPVTRQQSAKSVHGASNFHSRLHRRLWENTIIDGSSAVSRGVMDYAGFVTEEAAPTATAV
jgi:hypothetical protein